MVVAQHQLAGPKHLSFLPLPISSAPMSNGGRRRRKSINSLTFRTADFIWRSLYFQVLFTESTQDTTRLVRMSQYICFAKKKIAYPVLHVATSQVVT